MKAGDAILFDYGPCMPSKARATLARSQETLHLVVAALRSLHRNGGNPWGLRRRNSDPAGKTVSRRVSLPDSGNVPEYFRTRLLLTGWKMESEQLADPVMLLQLLTLAS